MVECEANDYLIDREEQKTKSYTGIEGIHTQDQCVTESMGGTIDRSFENLAPSDIAIARNRRMLANTVKAFQNGVRPPSADDPTVYANARGGHYTTTAAGDWIDIYQQEVDKLRARPPKPPNRIRNSAAPRPETSGAVSLAASGMTCGTSSVL